MAAAVGSVHDAAFDHRVVDESHVRIGTRNDDAADTLAAQQDETVGRVQFVWSGNTLFVIHTAKGATQRAAKVGPLVGLIAEAPLSALARPGLRVGRVLKRPVRSGYER